MKELKIGNNRLLTFTVTETIDGVTTPVTNLSDALEIYFMIKTNATDADNLALVSKSLSGVGDAKINIDTPEIGDLQLRILSSETGDKATGHHPWACQIEWPDDNDQEVDIFSKDSGEELTTIEFTQDTIRGTP